MKYYAVTDDPTELMHYGVKGMKWGQHLFGDKQKSDAFKRAATKLRASMKSGIKKTNANWQKASANRAAKKEAKKNFKEAQFNAKAQARLDEALGTQANKAVRKEQAVVRREARQERAAERREDRKMQRYLQKARHGTLKYKHLRDDQIANISERLNLENQARRLSGNETPHMLTRVKRSIGEGVVRGVGSAVQIGIEENARAKAKYKSEKKYSAKSARVQAEAKRIKDKEDRRNQIERDELFSAREAELQKQKDRMRRQNDLDNDRHFARDEASAEADKAYYKMLADTGEEAGRGELSGRGSARKRQQRVAQYRETKFLDDARKDAIKDFVKRGKKEEDKDYFKRVKDIESMFKSAPPNSEAEIKEKQPKSRVRRTYQPGTLKSDKDVTYELFGVESARDTRRRMKKEAELQAKRERQQAERDAEERERYRRNMAAWSAEIRAAEKKQAEKSIAERYAAKQNNSSYSNLYPHAQVTWTSSRAANDKKSRQRRQSRKNRKH